MGGKPKNQVFGVEIDPTVYKHIAEKLSEEFGVRKQNLVQSDFFSLDHTILQQVDVIVGNPPFIRYQRFTGDARKTALTRVGKHGVHLTGLSSSWAPFLIHSIAMLKQGGRLAMVVPMELCHAAYATPVLEYLSKSFSKVTFLTFRKKLFPDLSEDTLLLLAENKGSFSSEFFWRDLAHADLLAEIQQHGQLPLPGTRGINSHALSQGNERLIEYFIPLKARELYRRLKHLPVTRRLGELADVGIGYVTGANDFFHLHPNEAQLWGIPETFLRPAIRRGRALVGLRFTRDDWRTALEKGEAGYLLYIESGTELPKCVRRYLRNGEILGVSKAYKCRTRSPWFHVPHVYQPDAFLSYMSGVTHRLVANDAGVVAPNSLHILRLYPHAMLTSNAITALWQTSLTRLSVEIEGHALGGGMLKLEPTEAEHVVVASPPNGNGKLMELAEELDALIRSGDEATAQVLADKMILKEGIGLNQSDCRLLQTAGDTLRNRRYYRGKIA
jgi:hypothetical protein